MVNYRDLVAGLQKRAGIPFDAALLSLSVVVKALCTQLSASERVTFKASAPPELKQLAVESRAGDVGRNGRMVVEMIGATLEIDTDDAKRRALIVIEEMRAAVGPWDDAAFAELLDNLYLEIRAAFVQAAVA